MNMNQKQTTTHYHSIFLTPHMFWYQVHVYDKSKGQTCMVMKIDCYPLATFWMIPIKSNADAERAKERQTEIDCKLRHQEGEKGLLDSFVFLKVYTYVLHWCFAVKDTIRTAAFLPRQVFRNRMVNKSMVIQHNNGSISWWRCNNYWQNDSPFMLVTLWSSRKEGNGEEEWKNSDGPN